MNSVVFERVESLLIQRLTNDGPSINHQNQEGRSLLHFACEHGLEDLFLILIKLGAQIDMVDNNGITPLMLACSSGSLKIVESLLEAGADPTIYNHYGTDSTAMALLNSDEKIFLKLNEITKNDIYNSILGRISQLHIAAALGQKQHVHHLCKHFPDNINVTVEKSGMTSLMLASCGRFNSTIDILLDFGADKSNMVSSIENSTSHDQIKTAKTEEILDNFNFTPQKRKITISLNDLPLKLNKNNINTPQKFTNRFLNVPSNRSDELKHPLTPNICVSPKSRIQKNINFKVKDFCKLKHFRRSKSVENKTTIIKSNESNRDILEYILISTQLYECWPIFKSNEINYKTFLTMNDNDLKSIGIMKSSLRSKILKVIKHNKRVFC